MVLEFLLAIVGIGIVATLIAKKVNATVALFVGGLVMMLVAPLLGRTDTGKYEIHPSGNILLDQLDYIGQIFAHTTKGVGMIIMVLFGFSAYMSHIGANQSVVTVLTRPLLKLKAKYLLVPLVFWVGNVMSLAVPSASSLALILMATLFPALIGAGLSPLTAGAVIATTATIMPTPLGADNVIAAQRLGIDLDHYVFALHAMVSIPTLIAIGVVHYFWQKYMDKRAIARGDNLGSSILEVEAEQGPEAPLWYAIFPVLPLLLILVPFILGQFTSFELHAGLIPVTLVSIILAVIAEIIRKRTPVQSLEDLMIFFRGMGKGFGAVVTLVIAANILVQAIIQLGIVDALTNAVAGINGAALLLFLAFGGLMLLLSLLVGGVSPFYSLVEIAPPVAAASGINGALLTLPLQLVGNLARACSPISAVILIVSSAIKVNPIQLVARTAVPMGFGIVMSMIMTWFIVGV